MDTSFAKEAAENADPDNWNWSVESRATWELAGEPLQEFNSRWYGATTTECGPMLDSEYLMPLSRYFGSRIMSIFVRESYVKVFDDVWERALSSGGYTGAIITGSPGVGKHLFLHYFLVRLLQQKQIVLFSSPCGNCVYLFYHDHVYTATTPLLYHELPTPKSRSSDVFIWSLFEMPTETQPPLELVSSPCLPVQTAGDPLEYRSWLNKLCPLLTGLPVWTRDELAQALPYQHRYASLMEVLREVYEGSQGQNDSLPKFPDVLMLLSKCEGDKRPASPEEAINYLLETAIDRFGCSARDVFHGVFNPDIMTVDHEHSFFISYASLEAAVRALLTDSSANFGISHNTLVRIPVYRGPFESPGWSVNFKSDWIAKSVVQRLEVTEEMGIRQQIKALQWCDPAKPLVRWFAEPYAHRCIAQTATGGSWPLLKMVVDDNDPLQCVVARGPSSRVPNDVQFLKINREAFTFKSTANLPKRLENNVYYTPEMPIFPLLDAFTVDIDRSNKSAVLWVLQFSMSQSPGGSVVGNQNLSDIIARLKDQLLEDPPVEKIAKVGASQTASGPRVQVRYLLVVPEGESQSREWRFSGWSEKCKRDDPPSKNVYCLEIPLSVFWARHW